MEPRKTLNNDDANPSGHIARLEVLDGGEGEKWRDAGQINLLSENKDQTKAETKVKPLSHSVKRILRNEKYYTHRHSPDGIDTNLLVLFHGSGDSHLPYDRLAKTMALPQTAILSISASIPDMFVTIPFDLGYTWFEEVDYFQTGMDLPPNHPQRLKSLHKSILSVKKILSYLIKDNGWLPERIFLFGFSCGACLAMETALDLLLNIEDVGLSPSRPLGGVICIAGGVKCYHHQTKRKNSKQTKNTNSTPILIVAGSHDPNFSQKQAEESKLMYDNASCFVGGGGNSKSNVSIHIQRGKGHTMISSAEEMRAVMKFISTKLVKRMIGLEGISKN